MKQSSHPLTRGSVLALTVLVGAMGLSMAQSPVTAEPAVPDHVTTAPVPPAFASARATMRTFLEAFAHDDGVRLDEAVACLDLAELPAAVREGTGRELAVVLKGVIDRTRFVEFARIPDDPDGAAYVFLRQKAGEVVIDRVADGRWLFTSETVRSLDALRRATEEKAVVEGVQAYTEAVSPAQWLRQRSPGSLRGVVLGLELWQWLGLIVFLAVGFVAGRVFRSIALFFSNRFLRRRFAHVDSRLVARALRPAGALVMVLVWWLGIGILGLPVKLLALYAEAVWIVLLLAACATAYHVVSVVADALQKRADTTENRADDVLVPLLRKALKVLVVAVGVVFVAEALHRDLTGLVTGLGLGGLAFALAAKDAVSNLFGSITVLLDRPFQVGDWVAVGSVEGTVEEVGFRSTRIRTGYNSLITLPNSNLTNAAVDNLGVRQYRRWSTRLGIAYDTPPELIDAFCEGVRELIRCHPDTRKDGFHVYLNEFGESGLEVFLYVFFVTRDWAVELRSRHRLAGDIIRLASSLGVSFAFPTRTLYLRQEEWSVPRGAPEGYDEGSSRMASSARELARAIAGGAEDGSSP